jgi:DNA polymerase-1
MLLNILKAEEPDALVFCFDAGEETFRHQENETYKEGRADTPDDFYTQIPRIIELIDAFGFRHISDTRYEADDFLCSYAREGERAKMKVSIVTGDRDLYQLAGDSIAIILPHKGMNEPEYLDAAGVERKLGVRPDQVASYKGLCGDSSDNLPGVRGIGPKTAVDLLKKYDTLKGVYEHLDEIRPSVKEKLERDREQAFFCERMAVLVCDIDLPIALKDLTLANVPTGNIVEFFSEMEFNLLTKRLQTLVATEYGRARFAQTAVIPALATKSAPVRESEGQLALFDEDA